MAGASARRMPGTRLRPAIVGLAFALVATVSWTAASQVASAADTPFPVTSTADLADAVLGDGNCATSTGVCTLRAAVQEINAKPPVPPNTASITLQQGATYHLTRTGAAEEAASTGDLDVRAPMTINGNGATVDAAVDPTINPPPVPDRVFEVRNGPAVTINDLSITGGNAGTGAGGGIAVQNGNLTLNRSSVWNNQAGQAGGGIFLTTTGPATINSSTISGNTAPFGAGLWVHNALAVNWSTITDNVATTTTGASGIFIETSGQSVHTTLTGTIVAKQRVVAGGGSHDCALGSGSLAITTNGSNLDSDSSCGLSTTTDKRSADPLLNPLNVNGWPTPAHTPRVGSAVIEGSTTTATCPALDQLGSPRPDGTRCDIGAVESIAVERTVQTRQQQEIVKLLSQTGNSAPQVKLAAAFANYLLDGTDPTITPAPDKTKADAVMLNLPPNNNQGHSGEVDLEFDLSFMRMAVHFQATVQPRMSQAARDAVYGTAANPGGAIARWATVNCSNYANEWRPDAWHHKGTENLSTMRRVNCLLALYQLQNTAPFNTPTGPNYWTKWRDAFRTWIRDQAKIGLLDEVQSPQYEKYTIAALYNLADFPGDPDLARVTTNFLRLFWHDVAHNFNANTGVVSAAGTRIYQPASNGTSFPSESSYYTDPTANWLRDFAWMYGWHDLGDPNAPSQPNPGTPSAIIEAATNAAFRPLPASRSLAKMTGKAIEYASVRPTRHLVNADGSTDQSVALPGQPHYVRRSVSATDAYTMGAMTWDTRFNHSGSGGQSIWASVTPNDAANLSGRIMITGVGAPQPTSPTDPTPKNTYSDYYAFNAAEYKDVIIAARDFKASQPPGVPVPGGTTCPTNQFDDQLILAAHCGYSLGERIFIGPGPFRANLIAPPLPSTTGPDPVSRDGWWFTMSGNTFVGIRVPVNPSDGALTNLRAIGDIAAHTVSELRLDNAGNGVTGTGTSGQDIWAPFVVQVGEAKNFTGANTAAKFLDFQNKVKALTWTYSCPNSQPGVTDPVTGGPVYNCTLEYKSLRSYWFRFSRQEVAAQVKMPEIGSIPAGGTTPVYGTVNTDPGYAYQSGDSAGVSYLDMARQGTFATLRGATNAATNNDAATIWFD